MDTHIDKYNNIQLYVHSYFCYYVTFFYIVFAWYNNTFLVYSFGTPNETQVI